MSRPLRPIVIRAALFAVCLMGDSVLACWGGIADSVHFYSPVWSENNPKPDFGRLPQRVLMPGWSNEVLRGGELHTLNPDSGNRYNLQNEARWNDYRARNLEARGQYRQCLRAYLLSNADPSFKQDRKELFQSVKFREVKGLSEYLRNTFLLSQPNNPQYEIETLALESLRCDPRLEPHREYAVVWLTESDSAVLQAQRYFELYRRFPNSSRAESALIMAARTLLESAEHRPISREDVKDARIYLHLLLQRFPKSRFREDAEGWLTRCLWLEGKEGRALSEYRERAEHGSTPSIRWMAYESIEEICRTNGQFAKEIKFLLLQRKEPDSLEHQVIASKELRKRFGEIGAADAKLVQREIRRNPLLLDSYVAFRIEDTKLDRNGEANLLAFAESCLKQMPNPGPELLTRVAQIAYNDGHYGASRVLSVRVLKLNPKVELEARARDLLAASLARLGMPKQAILEYQRFAKLAAPDYLRQAGLEHLALLQERNGYPVEALATYTKLKYDWDAAYLADAELTPRELSRYIDEYASPDQKPVMIYTLGMRYFREGDYARAITAFSRLSLWRRLHYGLPKRQLKDTLDQVTTFDQLPKQRDPIKSVRTIWQLSRTAHSTHNANDRAKALYAMAAYMYRERTLLFYSPGLWKGERANSISYFWSSTVNTSKDNHTLDRYCHEHETLVHVMNLCKSVEDLHPREPVLAKTLYTAGLAEDHLANLNGWWRGQKGLKKQAIASMKRLVRLFPRDPLAKPAAKYAQVFVTEDQPEYAR